MPFIVPSANALPGMQNLYVSQPRDIFYADRDAASFFAPPPAIDGTASSNPQNSPYVWLLWAGMPVGKITASGLFATSIIGQTSTVVTGSSSTTFTTDANSATEIVRRLGASGTLTLTGPATANGTMHTETVTYSNVNTTTGVVTISTTTNSYVSGSWIQPVDGSQTIVTLLAEDNGVKVVDMLNTTRVNAFTNRLWVGGGVINTSYIVNYPSDTSMQTYLKNAIKVKVPNAVFSDDFTG